MLDVDWDALRGAAREVATRSYSPYSGFRVGAAARCADGAVVAATNVENASHVAGICAETALVGMWVAAGYSAGGVDAVAVTDAAGNEVAPCGRCRQLLHESGGPDLMVNGRSISSWLPDAFGPDHLR